MPTWSVTLSGDPTDLRALVALGVGVTEEGDAFVFRSPDLDGLDALQLFAGQPSPVNLYRVFEVVRQDAGGEDKIIQNGWITKKQISRFRHTMNSVAALGAEARHGVEATEPPADPMSMAEAREFITRLLEQWLASK